MSAKYKKVEVSLKVFETLQGIQKRLKARGVKDTRDTVKMMDQVFSYINASNIEEIIDDLTPDQVFLDELSCDEDFSEDLKKLLKQYKKKKKYFEDKGIEVNP